MVSRFLLAALIAVSFGASVNAQTLSTSFDTADGFTTGSDATVALLFDDGVTTATFAGGTQQQMFDGPSYNSGPAGLLFINSGPTVFTGTTGNTQAGSTLTGTVAFSTGVDNVSFFAADRANGTPSLSVLDTLGNVLLTQSITQTSNQLAAGATALSFDSAALGAQIGSIVFDNAGPAANPSYVIAIDTFSASINAVPEPASCTLLGLAAVGFFSKRRRKS